MFEAVPRTTAWLYAVISVILVSLCGLLGALVIPVMGYACYQQLLQFLVALAVGTLCGDALLHLLPHAMIPHTDKVHEVEHDHDHNATMWKGLAVLLGIVFFFFTEKFLNLGSEWRKKRQRSKKVQGHSHVQILNGNNEGDSVGEKLCKHKYSSYPYCYSDIKSNKDGHEHTGNVVSETPKPSQHDERLDSVKNCSSKWFSELQDAGEGQRLTHLEEQYQKEDEEVKQNATDSKVVENDNKIISSNEIKCDKKDGEYTVIIREHEVTHHGHSHAHGHVHSPPESLSSVAWMVILGDGLHNFTDGMAIGAAFSNNIAGGFSTAVAVFCHELPHELGDFAVLLKAGMTAKQAVFYNLISSILCFVGMCLGIFVGDNPTSTSWVFAISAGMFLYIGLVDMINDNIVRVGRLIVTRSRTRNNDIIFEAIPCCTCSLFILYWTNLPSLFLTKNVIASVFLTVMPNAFFTGTSQTEKKFPELTSSHSAFEKSFCQCSLQGVGLLSGVSIMFVIAYYEDYLLHLFQ